MNIVGRREKGSFLLFFCMILFFVLTACTTTHEVQTSNSPSSQSIPKQSSDASRAAIRLQLGINYLQQDQLETALRELSNAISIDSSLADAYGVRAVVYMQMRNHHLAEQDFLKVMGMLPDNPEHTNNYAWFLCMDGRERQAMVLFDRVIKNRSYAEPVKALNNAGLCSLRMKGDALAENYFSQSLRYDPNNPTTNLNLARLNYKKQDWTAAQFYVDRLVRQEAFTSEIVWLAIKVSHKLNDQVAESSLAVQLRRRFPESREYALLQRGEFDE